MRKNVAALFAASLLIWGATAQSTSPADTAPRITLSHDTAEPAPPPKPKPKPAASSAPRRATTTQNGYFLNLDAIPQVACAVLGTGKTEPDETMQVFTGTGTIIGRDRVLTAAHVVKGANFCEIKSKLARVIYSDDLLDVAVLAVDLGDAPVTPLSCDGFQAGHAYFGVGYAHGQDFAIQLYGFTGAFIDVTIEGHPMKHAALLQGAVFHGMSGGPIIDGEGRVTGILNAGDGDDEPVMVARDLADTPLCTALKLPPAPDKPVVTNAKP